MKNLKNETGRSMVEMLGVLAIIGVLSVGGIAGYRTAMQSHIANEINNNLKVAMVEYGAMECGTNKDIIFSDTMTASIDKGCMEGIVTNYYDNLCQNSVRLEVQTDYLDKSSLAKIGSNMYALLDPYNYANGSTEGQKAQSDYLFVSSISGDSGYLKCYYTAIGENCFNEEGKIKEDLKGPISITISNCP